MCTRVWSLCSCKAGFTVSYLEFPSRRELISIQQQFSVVEGSFLYGKLCLHFTALGSLLSLVLMLECEKNTQNSSCLLCMQNHCLTCASRKSDCRDIGKFRLWRTVQSTNKCLMAIRVFFIFICIWKELFCSVLFNTVAWRSLFQKQCTE